MKHPHFKAEYPESSPSGPPLSNHLKGVALITLSGLLLFLLSLVITSIAFTAYSVLRYLFTS